LRTLGGFFGGALGLLGIEASGWYIAISSVGVFGGALLGLAYGTILLPRFAVIRAEVRRSVWRWIAIAAVTAVLISWIVYPLVPDRDAQSLEVQVMRLVAGPEQLTVENTGLTTSEIGILRSIGLHGKLLGGIQSFSGGGNKQARALIIVSSPLSAKVTLREPRAISVVYVQEGDSWNMYPANAPTLRKTITLTNAAGEYEGLSVAIEPIIGTAHSFTWYPPIKTTSSSNR